MHHPLCRPSIEWEVLVVDYKPGDETQEMVEDFCRRYPNGFRYLFEAQTGPIHASTSEFMTPG